MVTQNDASDRCGTRANNRSLRFSHMWRQQRHSNKMHVKEVVIRVARLNRARLGGFTFNFP
jgi:hypothetical protein